MTKRLKQWTCVSAVVVACGIGALVPAHRSARAQNVPDVPAQQLTQAEALTISLLQSILVELVQLNHNIERLPAPSDQ